MKAVDFWGFECLVADDVTHIAMDCNLTDADRRDNPSLKFAIWTFVSAIPPVWDEEWEMWRRVSEFPLQIRRLNASADVIEEISKKTNPKNSLVYCGS